MPDTLFAFEDFVNMDLLTSLLHDLPLFLGYGFVAMTVLLFISFGVFKAFTFVKDL